MIGGLHKMKMERQGSIPVPYIQIVSYIETLYIVS